MINIEIPVSSTVFLRLLNIFIAKGPATPATGSSSNRRFGEPIRDLPISTNLDCPPDNSLAKLWAI